MSPLQAGKIGECREFCNPVSCTSRTGCYDDYDDYDAYDVYDAYDAYDAYDTDTSDFTLILTGMNP